jgi:hypothetical protein
LHHDAGRRIVGAIARGIASCPTSRPSRSLKLDERNLRAAAG